MGVTDHRIRDAADERPSDAAEPPATDHGQADPQFLGQLDYLRVWFAYGRVRVLDVAAVVLYPRHTLVEETP